MSAKGPTRDIILQVSLSAASLTVEIKRSQRVIAGKRTYLRGIGRVCTTHRREGASCTLGFAMR